MTLFGNACDTCGAPLPLTSTGGPSGHLDNSVALAASPTVNKVFCSPGCLEFSRGASGPPDRSHAHSIAGGSPFIRHHGSGKQLA